MSEMQIMKPGEATSHAARKGMTVLASADDQPSFREHLHPVVDKAVSWGPHRQEALILSERGDGPKAGTRTPLARMIAPPAFGAVTSLRSEADPTDLLDALFQEPPALPVRLSEPDRFITPATAVLLTTLWKWEVSMILTLRQICMLRIVKTQPLGTLGACLKERSSTGSQLQRM